MTKKELEKMVNEQIAVLFDYELTEKELEKIEKIGNKKSFTEKDLLSLQKIEDDATNRKKELNISRKQIFKWQALDGFYRMKLSTVTPEIIKTGWKISFRICENTIKRTNGYFYYNNPEKSEFSAIEFENNQDICTVKSIAKNGEIKVASDKNGGIWYITPDDIKNNCILTDGSKIAFLVYAPKTKKD